MESLTGLRLPSGHPQPSKAYVPMPREHVPGRPASRGSHRRSSLTVRPGGRPQSALPTHLPPQAQPLSAWAAAASRTGADQGQEQGAFCRPSGFPVTISASLPQQSGVPASPVLWVPPIGSFPVSGTRILLPILMSLGFSFYR